MINLFEPVKLTEYICNIASESGQEDQLADTLFEALSALPHLQVVRERNNIAAWTSLGREKRVIVAGHIDTVPVNRNLPVRRVSEAGKDFLWGRGTVDMKAGAAVALTLAAELTSPACDVTWIWYDNEEVAHDLNGLGLLHRLRPELFRADMAFLCEPSNAQVEAGCNGTLRAEITARGVRAHSARSWMGVNAIHALQPALARLAQYQPEVIEIDGLRYHEGLNAVGITGGVAGNVIPDLCTLQVNYRFAPTRTVAQASEKIKALFADFETVITDSAAGALPGLGALLSADFISHTQGSVAAKQGWTDVARFTEFGIPSLNYGPGNPELAHADNEQVEIEQIMTCYRTLGQWLKGS